MASATTAVVFQMLAGEIGSMYPAGGAGTERIDVAA